MKTCSRCGTVKPLDEFYRNRASRDGHTADCKPCRLATVKARHAANPSRRPRPRQPDTDGPPRVVCWYSCGAASAVATHLAIAKYGPDRVVAVYCDTSANEHPDNQRFRRDCEAWYGIDIELLASDRHRTVEDVFDATGSMGRGGGAPCTLELKKRPRYRFERGNDINVYGYTAEEERRVRRFAEMNPGMTIDWILGDAGLTKPDCWDYLADAGIARPAIYDLGFTYANCIGCVKATSPKYWNLVRIHFPQVFNHRAEQSRRLGNRLAEVAGRRVFLDELTPDDRSETGEQLSCSPFWCSSDEDDVDAEDEFSHPT